MRHCPLLLASWLLLVGLLLSPAAHAQPEHDLASPRTTVQTFLINVAQLEQGRQEEQAWQNLLATLAPDLAEQVPHDELRTQVVALADTLTRLGTAHPEERNLIPDAQAVDAVEQTRYVYFPDQRHNWVWEALASHDRYPTQRIVLERTDETWHFTQRTLEHAPELALALAPLPPRAPPADAANGDVTDALIQALNEMLGDAFAQTHWSGWLILLIAIFLSLLAGKLIGSLLNRLATVEQKRAHEMRALAFQDAANPASLALLGTGLYIGLGFIHTDHIEDLINDVLTLIYLIALGWFFYNVVNILEVVLRRIGGQENSTKLKDMLIPLIRKALRIFLVVMFALVAAQNVFGVNITAWIAGLGIAGLAVALAAQSSVQNVFGAVTVLLDKPFAVGDLVIFDGQWGTIEEIGFRSTKQRLITGHVVTIPNSRFIDSSIENVTRRKNIRRVMNITITYDTPAEKIEQAVQIVRDLLESDPQINAPFDMENLAPRCFFNDYNADSLNLFAIYWYILDPDKGQDWWGYNAHLQMFNLKLFRAFEDAGIEFAFPTQTLYLAGDPQRQLTVRTESASQT